MSRTDLALLHLENAHDALCDARLKALSKACEGASPSDSFQIIERFNSDPYWENQFADLEAEIRELDPDHEYLPENNIR